MILLRPDCLVFKTAAGENVPATAQEVTVELMSEQGSWLDPEIVQNAAAAVLHYFKDEKKQSTVSVAEFSEALERVLRGLGFDVKSAGAPATPKPEPEAPPTKAVPRRIAETNLHRFAGELGTSCELVFFPRLRDELRRCLEDSPQLLHFSGLRDCVKHLTGTRRWTPRCQSLHDQIVDYLRGCLQNEDESRHCPLVVQ